MPASGLTTEATHWFAAIRPHRLFRVGTDMRGAFPPGRYDVTVRRGAADGPVLATFEDVDTTPGITPRLVVGDGAR